jgi:hypothetical protein
MLHQDTLSRYNDILVAPGYSRNIFKVIFREYRGATECTEINREYRGATECTEINREYHGATECTEINREYHGAT